MLNWSKQFSIFVFLDTNEYRSEYGKYECLLAVGNYHQSNRITVDGGDPLSDLYKFHQKTNDWLFGHVAYDFKNNLEKKLSSGHPSKIGFPEFSFFRPDVVCYISQDLLTLTVESLIGNADAISREIVGCDKNITGTPARVDFSYANTKDDYLKTINSLREHIANGDCYEITYCVEGYCEWVKIDTLTAFAALNEVSPAPMAAYYRLNDQYLMSASPERYLLKEGKKIVAQPIKGTARRDTNTAIDNAIMNALQNDVKERAENVMIVDLVRNDLARSCEIGSVIVDELFGIYTFPQVHQMISTISGKLKNNVPFTNALRYSFPMGSMTGAPKIKAMELIEQHEQSRRELFAGSVGYITPGGDFDFNVIIRSLFYNASTQYLSYQTGGAITYDSNPQKEYDEMRLKAWALERIFS